MRNHLLIPSLFLLMLLAFSCTGREVEPEKPEPVIDVVATIYPLADIVGRIGGEKVKVSSLLPAGASPHTYEPTVEQARQIEQAELLIYVGAGLDDWAAKMFEAAGPGLLVIAASDRVPMIEAGPYQYIENDASCNGDFEQDCDPDHPDHDGHDCHSRCSHDHGPKDPHFWLDPLLVRDSLCPAVFEKLVALGPAQEAYFQQNYEDYRQELTLLHDEIDATLTALAQDSFITFHSAWQYFARRYGLREVAVIARFPGQEPSAGWLAELVELIEAEEIGAIFAEPQFPARLAENIAEEAGIEVLVLDPLGGENIAGRQSYLEMMRYNLSVFEKAMR